MTAPKSLPVYGSSSSTRASALNLSIGGFVQTRDAYGLGKLVDAEGKKCHVSFLHSIQRTEERPYDCAEVQRAILPAQTRVYARAARFDGWRMGRVIGHFIERGTVSYHVQFPNDQIAELPEDQIEARCLQPQLDPTEVLACGGMETQYFHDRRVAAINAILEARATSRGLTGLISSAIDFVPHQVEVVRRVLEDPVQRYMLADEVGMGKTIEAGAIIRQCLLDSEAGRVAIIVPGPLVRQWQDELRRKFDIYEFWGRVDVRSFADLQKVLVGDYELLVVDEAHHLITSDRESTRDLLRSPAYAHLEALAHSTPRLLLLSATPVLGNEDATLALLHLLDPVAYRLEEPEAFREKVDRRQDYGRVLLALDSGVAPVMLRRTAARLLELFPDDPVVADFVSRLAPSGASHQATIEVLLRGLKRHIAENYRLHQRLLRTRRKDTEGWELLPRKGRVVVDADEDERMPSLIDLVEDWRYRSYQVVAAAIEDDETYGTHLEAALAQRFKVLVEALGRGAEEFAQELDAQWRAVLAGKATTFEDEAGIVGSLRRALAESNELQTRLELAAVSVILTARGVRAPAGGTPKVVAFTSSTAFARQLYELLRLRHGTEAVRVVLEDTDADEVAAAVEHFRSHPSALIMICDQSGEEGLNLHFAHAIVHLDVPLSPARLEQRIGRLDRYGRREPMIRHRVVLPSDEDHTLWQAWYALLHDGFRVFNESVSEVQFLLERLEHEIMLALYRGGADGLTRLIEPLRARLQEERQKLDEQYALDRLEMGEDRASMLFESLEDAEADEKPLARALDGWLVEVLRLQRRAADDVTGVFSLHWTDHTLVPERPWRELLFPGLERPLTYQRTVAVQKPGVALMRPGLPMIDRLQKFMRWDDRGAAFATWRQDPDWHTAERGLWLGFRLTYVVETDLSSLARVVNPSVYRQMLPSLQRRSDAFLPPWLETLNVDVSLTEVSDPLLISLLVRPYEKGNSGDKRRDHNLGNNPAALFALIDPQTFAERCREVREFSETTLRASGRFVAHATEGARRAREELALRNESLQRRQEALRREDSRVDLTIGQEIEINAAIADAVLTPAVRLDSIGFFVLADFGPG